MDQNTSDWSAPPSVDPELDCGGNYTAAWFWLSSLQPSYLGLICVVGAVGNGLVLCVFCLQRKPCTVADVYLGNMAAADLVMVSCLPFWAVTIARGYHWAFGELLCKLVNVAISMNYYCSVMFLVLVTVDRYLALVHPMSPNRLRRTSWAKRICLAIWTLGFLLSLPILVFRTVSRVEVDVDVEVDACYLAYPHAAWRLQQNVTGNALGFLVPVLTMTYCSYHIVAALRDGRNVGLPGMGTERKATHLVLAVLAVFLFCWTPFQAVRLLDTLDYFEVTPGCLWGYVLDIAMQLSTYLAYSNSAANPFLFVIVGKHFRRRAREVFGKVLRACKKDVYLTANLSSARSSETQRISLNLKILNSTGLK